MNKQNNKSKGKATYQKRRQQPRKDSKSKRVNFDNERVSKFDKDEEFKDPRKTGASNDVRWYANNPELLRSAASLPFSTTTGLPLPTAKPTGIDAVPGIMSLRWRPSIGGAFIDPINQAAASTYSFVVHANSRNKSYDAPDLMQMILAGASLFSMVGFGVRAYGVMRTYSQMNSYLPKALVHAMGFDFSDLQSNLSKMWFDLNELIARCQQIWIPKNFPFIERWFWMNSNIYMDGSSIKSQYYMFTPSSYLMYKEEGDYTDDSHLANCTFRSWEYGTDSVPTPNGTLLKWSDYMTRMNQALNALISSQDRGIIFGDILKAYGAENIYGLSPISSDYTVVPIYDTEVLTQIENATICDTFVESIDQDPKTNWIYESGYSPYSQPVKYDSNPHIAPVTQILNFHQDTVPTPEQIMVATRLKCAGCASIPNSKKGSSLGDNNSGGLAPAACGTEVITGVYVSVRRTAPITRGSGDTAVVVPAGDFTLYSADLANMNDNTVTDPNKQEMFFNQLMLYFAFDWAPWKYNILYTKPWGTAINTPITTEAIEAEQPKLLTAIGDYQYYTIITVEELKKMHQTAIYSEFGVPTI